MRHNITDIRLLYSGDLRFVIRFRPSFFPFVEPGFEIDLKRGDKWIEILGAGMVHPNVLENCGIDSKKYQGFAFGMGLDRLMNMKLHTPDVRLSY